MQVTVNDVGNTGSVKSVVGTASVVLKTVIPKFNEPTVVLVNLSYQDAGKKKPAVLEGRVKMKAFLERVPEPPKPVEQPKVPAEVPPAITAEQPAAGGA